MSPTTALIKGYEKSRESSQHFLDIYTGPSLSVLNIEAVSFSIILVPIKLLGMKSQKTVLANYKFLKIKCSKK
jgi:hypothetical protein